MPASSPKSMRVAARRAWRRDAATGRDANLGTASFVLVSCIERSGGKHGASEAGADNGGEVSKLCPKTCRRRGAAGAGKEEGQTDLHGDAGGGGGDGDNAEAEGGERDALHVARGIDLRVGVHR